MWFKNCLFVSGYENNGSTKISTSIRIKNTERVFYKRFSSHLCEENREIMREIEMEGNEVGREREK